MTPSAIMPSVAGGVTFKKRLLFVSPSNQVKDRVDLEEEGREQGRGGTMEVKLYDEGNKKVGRVFVS